jgi:hypothetical protein
MPPNDTSKQAALPAAFAPLGNRRTMLHLLSRDNAGKRHSLKDIDEKN